MAKKKICLSPSSQTDNVYVGLGTTEGAVCGEIAQYAKTMLERCGFDVLVTHLDTLAQKVAKSDAFGADLHVPIHTNGYDGKVGGTRLFCMKFGGEGEKACKAVFTYLAPLSPGTSENIKEYPTLYEMRSKAPTCYIEAEFHDTFGAWIIAHKKEIAEAIVKGICDYFSVKWVPEKSPVPESNPDIPILDDGEDDLPLTEKDAFKRMLLQVIREDPQAVYDALGDVMYATLSDCPEWMQKEIAPMLEEGIIDGGTTADVNPLDINKRKSELTCIIVAGRLAKRQ